MRDWDTCSGRSADVLYARAAGVAKGQTRPT
jgi:hypothetical protein